MGPKTQATVNEPHFGWKSKALCPDFWSVCDFQFFSPPSPNTLMSIWGGTGADKRGRRGRKVEARRVEAQKFRVFFPSPTLDFLSFPLLRTFHRCQFACVCAVVLVSVSTCAFATDRDLRRLQTKKKKNVQNLFARSTLPLPRQIQMKPLSDDIFRVKFLWMD